MKIYAKTSVFSERRGKSKEFRLRNSRVERAISYHMKKNAAFGGPKTTFFGRRRYLHLIVLD